MTKIMDIPLNKRCPKGFTLIELVITIVLMGLLVIPLISMITELMRGSSQHAQNNAVVNLAISKMEEAVNTGVFTTKDSAYASGYFWVRDTVNLKGSPTDSLIAVEIIIKTKPGAQPIFTLKNHLALK